MRYGSMYALLRFYLRYRVSAQAPVLFFPGTLCDERIFMPLWQQLSIDQRRFVPLQWASSKEDMLALGEDRILPDEKVHLVGYSMGGYIAALIAARNKANIASITLIAYDPAGLTTSEISQRETIVKSIKKGQFKPDNHNYLARFIHPSRLKDNSVAEVVTSMAMDLGKSTLLAHTLATTPRENTLEFLKKINAPITLVGATDDNIAKIDSLRFAAKSLPNASLHEFENTGHMIPLEQTSQLAAIIDKCISVQK
jgi:pimeloyl-ACP methyl ester carboxylesterase